MWLKAYILWQESSLINHCSFFFGGGGRFAPSIFVLGFCDRTSWANCEERERERKKTNKMQQSDVYYQHCLNMFRASLCPSSGEQRPCVTACGVHTVFVLLKMDIMMPETCWDSVDNKHPIVAPCWFSLSFHNSIFVFSISIGYGKRWVYSGEVCHCYQTSFRSLPPVASTKPHFLGAVGKSRKATISFVMSLSPSAWNSYVPTIRIFTKFHIWLFFADLSSKIQVSLKYDKNNGYFTWRHMCMCDVSLNC